MQTEALEALVSVWLTVSKSVLSLNLAWLPGGVYAAPLVCKHTTIHIHGELKKKKKKRITLGALGDIFPAPARIMSRTGGGE